MKKETSVLLKLPIKMFIYTIIISFFVYISLYKFLEENFRREIRGTALTLSATADWALMPLLKDGDDHEDAIERLFEKITTNSMVKNIRVYKTDMSILYSNNRREEGSDIGRTFITPISEDGKLFIKKEDFSSHTYEIAIPIRDKALVTIDTSEENYILYLNMNFKRERMAHYKLQLLVFSIIAFFLILLLIINNSMIKHYILSPFLKMKKGLQGVAKGRYDFNIEMQKDKEVNELIRMFNQMVKNIKESSEALEKNRVDAEKLSEAKGAFLANMTHELRTPLNSIIGYSELLLEDEKEKDKLIKLTAVVGSGKHLLSIINNILDFSKIDAEKLKLSKRNFNIRKTFKSLEGLFKIHAFQKNLDFKFKVEEPMPEYLKGDESRIKQILINLLSNSFKFTENGSICVTVSYRANQLFVEVSDTGLGIKEEALPNIFNSFEQVDVHHKGTGLGLAITKALCNLMEGDIKVKSTVGQGTTFLLNIKVPVGAPPKKPALSNLGLLDDIFPPDEKKKRFKILVAEDVKDNQLVLEMMLKKLDVDIVFADNGKIALDLLRKDKFNLFLLDIQMPVMNGLEVLEELTSTGEIYGNYVVALTAYSMATEKRKVLDAGAKGILTKPLSKDEIRGLVSYRMRQEMR